MRGKGKQASFGVQVWSLLRLSHSLAATSCMSCIGQHRHFLGSGNLCLAFVCRTKLLHWLMSTTAHLLDQLIQLTWQMIGLGTCRSSGLTCRWCYDLAYQGCLPPAGFCLHAICSVWEVLIRFAMMTFDSLQPCHLVLCSISLASCLECRISWYLGSLLLKRAWLAPPYVSVWHTFPIHLDPWWSLIPDNGTCIYTVHSATTFSMLYGCCLHFSLFTYCTFASSFRIYSYYYMVRLFVLYWSGFGMVLQCIIACVHCA